MRPSTSEFLTLRDCRHHIRTWGPKDAPCFFFLHGWCDVSASLQFVVDELADEWRIIAPDWRGFGRSQWNLQSYWLADYIADLDALLGHYSPDGPVQIVGHSLGGNVAGMYAGVRPERVSRFVNLEGFGLWVSGPAEAPSRVAKWLGECRGGEGGFRRYRDAAEFAERLRRDNPRLTPERADFLARHSVREVEGGVMFAGDPKHRWTTPFLVSAEDAKACWRQAVAPTLWVGGRDSFIMKSFAGRDAEYRERLGCFRNVREVLLDDCGHNLHHDRPTEVARLIEGFLGNHDK